MGNPAFGFDDGFVGGSEDGFDLKGFDDTININTSVVEDFFGVTPTTPPEHEDKLIKDGNDLIQKDLEDRKKSREYDPQQTTKDRPQVETKVSMSFVDWSGFPGGAIHSAAIGSGSSEKKTSTISRRASLTNGGAKDDDQRRAVLLKSKRRSSLGPTTSTPEEEPQGPPRKEEPKFRNRRSSLRGGGNTHPSAEKQDPPSPRLRSTRRHSLDQGGSRHNPAERRASRRPAEDKEGTHPRIERKGSAKANSRESTGSGRPRRIQSLDPDSPPTRVRRPVQAAASSTTLEVNRIAPQRTTSGMRRPDRKSDRDPSSKVSLEMRNKGMLQKAPSIRSMQW